jgi:hypothetical protein
MFAIAADWLSSATLFEIEEIWLGTGVASAGSVQPMRQAKTPIQSEISVATPAFKL